MRLSRLFPAVALVVLAFAPAALADEDGPLDVRDTSSYEETLDRLQAQFNDLSEGDRFGSFPKVDLKDQATKKAKVYPYRVGDKVVTTEEIEFKRAKGTSSKILPKFSECTVTAVPGDTEGSVAEVEVDKTRTNFDPTAEQIIPVYVHKQNLEKAARERDAQVDYAAKVAELVSQHAPKRTKKIPKMLAAYKGKERALYQKLRAEFKLPEIEEDEA